MPRALNIGTGVGYSVLECLAGWNAAVVARCHTNWLIGGPGDVAACYAKTSLARDVLGWSASRSLEEMCVDHWRWQEMNPTGYEELCNEIK